MSTFPRAGILGLVSGSRSTLGLAALAASAQTAGGRPNRWVVRAAVTAAAGELVGDKLPQAPSRLDAPGFYPRLVLGAASGALLSAREGHSRGHQAACAALGMLAAAAGAQLGASWRTLAADQFGHDLPGALAEDGLAMGAAALATRAW